MVVHHKKLNFNRFYTIIMIKLFYYLLLLSLNLLYCYLNIINYYLIKIGNVGCVFEIDGVSDAM